MHSFVLIPATSLLVFSIMSASMMNICQGLSSTTQKPVYLYYKEIAVITDRLATWKPSKNPNDLPGAYKDLQALSAKLNETTDVAQKYPGKFDEQSAASISESLDKITQDVLNIDGNIKNAKEIFIGFNTTSQIVQILQSFGNQFSILFDQTEKHFPSDQCEKIRESDAQTICAIQDATAYLDDKACLPQGRVFCSAYENGHPIPIDPKRICTNNQLGVSETYYIENGGSS